MPEMSAGIIVDPKAKPEGAGASRTVETQVELKFKQPGRKETISLQLNIGPNGFEEAAVEAVIKEIKIKERLVGDVITDVKLKFKMAVGVEFEKKDAEQKVGDFQSKVYAKLKASLSFKLKTPIPGHKIEPEIFSYTDIAGKPGVGLSITVFEF